MIAAADTTGCDAVHPGCGFLAENPAFVARLRGRTTSSSSARRRRDGAHGRQGAREGGDERGRRAARPGSDGGATLAEAQAPRRELGYPILLKAARGRRRQGDAARVDAGRARGRVRRRRRPRRRRRSGTASLYVEKAVVPARHVEIQVLCDAHGGVLTLGERECSIQRRHQKLIEESPSPALDAGDARGDGGRGRARLPRDRLPQRRHVRVPPRPGRRASTSSS